MGDASQQDSAAETHFGFRTVREGDKKTMVGDVFRRVANNYDVMNDVMSGTVHRLWKDCFADNLGPRPRTDGKAAFLDVAGGTGDIAFRIMDRLRRADAHSRADVVVSDINPSMLAVGRERAVQRGYTVADSASQVTTFHEPCLRFVEGDAERLPFDSNSFDAYTIAFGIRNVTHVDAALKEAFRVLRPGGRFLCLEFSHVSNPLLAPLYDAYSFHVIPTMGHVIANDREAYQYLVESIRRFPSQETFADMIRHAGFQYVTYENLSFGVVAVHSGFKGLEK